MSVLHSTATVREYAMHDAQSLLQTAEMRLDRALLNVGELIDSGEPINPQSYVGSITRLVISMNTMAQALRAGASEEAVSNEVANLLWRFGESLGIQTDAAR